MKDNADNLLLLSSQEFPSQKSVWCISSCQDLGIVILSYCLVCTFSFCHFADSENDCLLLRPLPPPPLFFSSFFHLSTVSLFLSTEGSLLFSFRSHSLQFSCVHAHAHRKSTYLATDKQNSDLWVFRTVGYGFGGLRLY